MCFCVFHSCKSHCPVGGRQLTWKSQKGGNCAVYFTCYFQWVILKVEDSTHVVFQSLYMDLCSVVVLYLLYMFEFANSHLFLSLKCLIFLRKCIISFFARVVWVSVGCSVKQGERILNSSHFSSGEIIRSTSKWASAAFCV